MAPRLSIIIALSGSLLACGTVGVPTQSPDRIASAPIGVEPKPDPEPPADLLVDRPADPPPRLEDQCQQDSDCGVDAHCVTRIIASCDVCAGGPVVRVCESQPATSCPEHVSCMPPRPCDDLEELRGRCPNTQIVY